MFTPQILRKNNYIRALKIQREFMKKIVSMLAVASSVFIYGQAQDFHKDGIAFENLPYKELLAKAKKENKLVFIDAYASWCGPCKQMAKNIFTRPAVKDFYDKNFVNAAFDMEKGEGREIAQKFGVRSYPTYLFINGDGELVSQSMGYMEENLFLKVGQDANLPENKNGSLIARFEKGEKDPDFLLNMMKMYSQTNYELAKKASERYFTNKKPSEYTKDDVGMLLFFIRSSSDINYKILKDNKAVIAPIMGEEQYTQYYNQFEMLDIIRDAMDDKNKVVKEAEFMARATPLVGPEVAQKILTQTKLSFYEQHNDFVNFEKTALEYFKDPETSNPQELLKAAWIFAEQVKDKKSLKTALMWAEKIVMRGETPENTYILAKLHSLVGNKSLALDFAKLSKSLAQQTGQNTNLADGLLNELN